MERGVFVEGHTEAFDGFFHFIAYYFSFAGLDFVLDAIEVLYFKLETC
jgi:hypothetical protein